jgi:hypothetical protein
MTKEMIISSNVHETIVAILEDDLSPKYSSNASGSGSRR